MGREGKNRDRIIVSGGKGFDENLVAVNFVQTIKAERTEVEGEKGRRRCCFHSGQTGKGEFVFAAADLLRRDIERDRPEVDLPVGVDARDDEEDPGALGAALAQTTEAEDDGTLVLLDHLE